MPPPTNLRAFLALLRERGELVEIDAAVDPRLEMTEIACRLARSAGPAILFRNPVGSSMPVLLNLLGTPDRMRLLLGRAPSEIAGDLERFLHDAMPPSPRALWSHRSLLLRATNVRLAERTSAPWRAQSGPGRLSELPALHCWPEDGGRFITWPLVITRHPERGDDNLGLYRMQIFSDDETGMHWQIGKGGAFHHAAAERLGRDLPCAVVIGADPLLLFAGMMPLPEGISELAFAGFLRGTPTRIVRSADGLPLPVEAEIVLEGVVPAGMRRLEGPFGDHFGHYSAAADFPVFRIRRQWQRAGAISVAAVVGKPPQEDMVLGNAVQDLFLPLLKLTRPEVRDAWAHYETGFHALLTVSMRPRYEKESLKTAFSLLGEGQVALTKVCIVVREDVDCRDAVAVLREIARRFDPRRDALVLPNTSADTLDFSGPRMNHGSKMIVDLTGPPIERGPLDTLPDLASRYGDVERQRMIADSVLLVRVRDGRPGRALLEELLRDPSLAQVPWIVIVSHDVDLDDRVDWLWGWFTRFDPASDVIFARTSLRGAVPVHEGSMGIDATWKPGYPRPLEMPADVVKRIDERWEAMGLGRLR